MDHDTLAVAEKHVTGGDLHCDDNDPARSPDKADLPGDDIDQNCDGALTCYTDLDGDGRGTASTTSHVGESCDQPLSQVSASPGDCDDHHADVFPTDGNAENSLTDFDCESTKNVASDAAPMTVAIGQGCNNAGSPLWPVAGYFLALYVRARSRRRFIRN